MKTNLKISIFNMIWLFVFIVLFIFLFLNQENSNNSVTDLKKSFAQVGGNGVMLFEGNAGCTTGVDCCPPNFTEITTGNNRYIAAKTNAVGVPVTGGGDGSHTHGGGDHSHPFNFGHDPCCGGGATNPNGGGHSHSGGANDHLWVGLRLCQWTIH